MLDQYPPVSPKIRLLAGVNSAAVLVSAVALAIGAVCQPFLVDGLKPAWILMGFELVSLTAAVMGILFWRGQFRHGPGLALACVAGTILLASGLGGLSAQWTVANQSIKLLVVARAAAAGLIALSGAACVLGRDPRGWPTFLKGVLWGLPILALAAWFVKAGGAFLDPVNNLGTVARMIAYGLGSLVIGISMCVSVHLIVKAFEFGRFKQDEEDAGVKN